MYRTRIIEFNHMLTINEARGYLTPEVSRSLSDTDLAVIREQLQILAEIFVEQELERR